jgi:putative transposase
MSRETSRGKACVRQLCKAFKVSPQAYYRSKQRPVRVGEQRRRRQASWASASELEVGIERVVEGHPGWGVRKVWAYLRREGLIASRKRIWAVMRAKGWVLAPLRERKGSAPGGQGVVADSSRRWATDLTTAWTRKDGVAAIAPVVDGGDRYVLACEVSKSQEASVVLFPVEKALRAEFGTPRGVPWGLELRSDHGPQYTGGDCEALCHYWGIEHTLAPVGRPTGNAVAERLIQTLKVELIWTRDWETIAELREAITVWMEQYNHQRPHQALDWETPAERRAKNLRRKLELAA